MMEKQVNNGKLEVIIRLDGAVELLDRLQTKINDAQATINNVQYKIQSTQEALATLKDRLLTIWAAR